MAAPTVQTGNQKGASSGNETTTVVTVPTTAPANDLIFVPMGSDANGQVSTFPGAFTKLYNDEAFQTVATAVVAYKTSAGGESNVSVGLA